MEGGPEDAVPAVVECCQPGNVFSDSEKHLFAAVWHLDRVLKALVAEGRPMALEVHSVQTELVRLAEENFRERRVIEYAAMSDEDKAKALLSDLAPGQPE